MTGDEIDGFDEKAVKNIMDAPETKAMLRDAFRKSAVQLQVPKAEDVIDRIETLVRELCYIEALREEVNKVAEIRKMLPIAEKKYGGFPQFYSAIKRCDDLILEGERELCTPIAMLDIKFGSIMNVLKDINVAIEEVRQARDSVRFLLFDWHPVFVLWNEIDLNRAQKLKAAIESLYRILMGKLPTARSILKSM